jgi:8-oxo-dGTP pyrophosphatase MutT (NUDIX family)
MAHAVRKAESEPDQLTKKDAAVLITLFEKGQDNWHILFIRRITSEARDKHSGQIAFPGGKRDADDPDLMYTALREAEEETSIDLTAIDVIGPLSPLYITVSKYLVHPFLAYSRITPQYQRQASEIDEILEIPLNDFRHPDSRQETRIRLDPGIILNHVPSFQIHGQTIWGATAMMMSELLELIEDGS